MLKLPLINSKCCGKDNFNFNTTNFQAVPQSYYTSKVLCEVTPEQWCVQLEVLECHLHSTTKLKDPAPGIIMQPVPARSAQQLCSALETNWEASSLPPSWMGTRVRKNPLFFIPPCMLHLLQAASKWLPIAPALWKLSSSLFLFQPKALQVPHLKKSLGVKGK